MVGSSTPRPLCPGEGALVTQCMGSLDFHHIEVCFMWKLGTFCEFHVIYHLFFTVDLSSSNQYVQYEPPVNSGGIHIHRIGSKFV
jgi:hypothetical protein